MKYNITCLFICFTTILYSQNLVLNPSFENYKECPTKKGEFNKNVMYWSTSNYGTTDYFNACNINDLCGNYNYTGYQKARTGNGYAGFYTFAPDNYKEYVQGQLKAPLIKGKEYNITFYISLSDCSSHATKDLGILLTEKELNPLSSKFVHLKNLDKKQLQYTFTSIENKAFYTNTTDWIEISTTYKAKGFEQFISIGNFDINRVLDTKKVKENTQVISSYYYIDDVNIMDKTLIKKDTTIAIPIIKTDDSKELAFKIDEVYTFKNLQFDYNKVDLLDNSIKELHKLYNYLIEHSNLNIEIYGHTDNVGSTEFNTVLSKKRAITVSNYLINLGIPKDRIKSFGFGSSKPLTNLDLNAAKNRRVEFKLITQK